MPIFKQISGSRRQVRRVRRYVSGAWQEQLQVESQVGSAQVDVHKTIELNITADDSDYNIFTEAGSRTDPVTVVLTVAAGVTVSKGGATYGLTTGSGWSSESYIYIVNYGSIQHIAPGSGGSKTAINMDHDLNLYNAGTGDISRISSSDVAILTNGNTLTSINDGIILGIVS